MCNDCWSLSVDKTAIPRCLANDNFIGYAHEYIVRHQVTWLEATIACPIFTGVVTYYVEGTAKERGHMMREPVGRPKRAWAVRGNIFSFLLPWEKVMKQLSTAFLQGDFSEWPLDQDTACKICRIRFVRGEAATEKDYPFLRVRSQTVKDMAFIYVQNHIADLRKRVNVLKLDSVNEHADLAAKFREHIQRRVDKE